VGILGKRDFDSSPVLNSLISKGTDSQNLIPESSDLTNPQGVRWSSLYDNAVAFSGIMSDISGMKFLYSKDLATVTNQAMPALDSIVTSVYRTFFEHDDPIAGTWLDSNGNVKWDVVSKVAQVVIYNKLNKVESDTDNIEYLEANNFSPGFSPKPGVPYLVFKDLRTTKTKTDRTRFIHIKMTPKKITKTHPYYNTIAQAYSAVQIIEELTQIKYGTRAFSDFIQRAGLSPEQKQAFLTKTAGLNPTEQQKEMAENIAGIKSFFTINPETKAIEQKTGMDLAAYLSLYTNKPDQLAEAINRLMPLIFKAKSVTYAGTLKEAQEKLKQVKLEQGELGENFVIENSIQQAERDTTDSDKRVWLIMDKTTNKPYREWQMSVASSPLQTTVNALAKANKKINGIQIRVNKKSNKRNIVTGKSILSSETTGVDFYQEWRSYLASDEF
jgi:hypothetical protein